MTHTPKLDPPVGGAAYDPEADALYVRFREAEHGRSLPADGNGSRILHLDTDGEVYAIEELSVRARAAQDATAAAATFRLAGKRAWA